ncbi:MAG: DUF2264 domain-containing protein [Paludibacter sp.]|nr:DUF2264 domain-containing protein [Paludibacter sp.]
MKISYKILSLVSVLLLFFHVSDVGAVNDKKTTSPHTFIPQYLNYKLSPYSGITREHWKDAALYLLQGAFSYINGFDDPMKFSKQPGVSYPRKYDQIPTEKLEGLCRTLFVAVPLLKEKPELEINSIKVADYYRHQIGLLINPESPSYIKHRTKNGGAHQNLVEFGALAMSLTAIPEVLWEPLRQSQKDSLAAVMLSYGDGPTVDSNWKFFNIFVLSFFKDQGYKVNEKLLLDYLDKSLTHYRGDGWYHDSPAFDYYSMWAFQMYGSLWSEYYGKKYYPDIAIQFMKNFNDLNDNYPYLFSRDGKMIMWGRSIAYRFASVTPFPLMGLEYNPNVNYGWLRRIASSTLMQFLEHPDFLSEGVPTLGFYGTFEPAVQMYSCRGSVYWSGKVFLGLLVPENNPFWTAVENEGSWEKQMKHDSVYNKFSKGSAILITDYPNVGASEIRAWCYATVKDDWQKFRSSENYNRLSYNSAFPWQADGKNGEVAMNYVLKNDSGEWEALRLYTFKKFENGIYYRDAVLETNRNIQFKLADIPIPNGILRVDKLIFKTNNVEPQKQNIELRLGHYALPQFDTMIKEKSRHLGSNTMKSIDNGAYQLSMITWKQWGKMQFVHAAGLHPQSNESRVINAFDTFETGKCNEKIYVTIELWKASGKEWTNKELTPVKKVRVAKDGKSIEIFFSDKSSKKIF